MAILRSSCDTRNQSGCSRSKLQMRAASLASGSCLAWFMEKAETGRPGLTLSPVLSEPGIIHAGFFEYLPSAVGSANSTCQ